MWWRTESWSDPINLDGTISRLTDIGNAEEVFADEYDKGIGEWIGAYTLGTPPRICAHTATTLEPWTASSIDDGTVTPRSPLT